MEDAAQSRGHERPPVAHAPVADEHPTQPDPQGFYEEYVRHHVPYHRNPRGLKGLILRVLPYWSYREWRFWRSYIRRCETLLDLGCARGREIFAQRADRTIGVDIARNALVDCASHYTLAARAELAPLPFADDSVDCVVTSHVMGHIPPEEKDGLVAEMMRVLKPGGRSLHWIETDSTHPLVTWAKKDPALYHEAFIQPDGHIGLEMSRDVVARFERHGFRVLSAVYSDSVPFHPRLMVKHFDNAYREASRDLDRRVRWSRRLLDMPVALAAVEVGLGLHHVTLGRRAGSAETAQFVGLVLEKPSRGDHPIVTSNRAPGRV